MSLKLTYFFCFGFFLTLTSQTLLEPDKKITTQGQVTIRGAKVPYEVTTGTQPVWDDKGKMSAYLHYTYYRRSDINQLENRPLLISFNGGPGSASVWMHLAYTGPKILKIDDEGYPVQPYGVKDNPYSVLDATDILYVNPINTGYSRFLLDEKDIDKSKYFGVNADIKYLADWITTFVSRNNRWLSPKYIIGESYGGTRVAGLSLALQNQQWMYLNGVILVSPADYKSYNQDNAVSNALSVPYYAATAWHHKKLNPSLQQKDLLDILPEVENFTVNQLIPALVKGGFLDQATKENLAQQLATYTGINAKVYLQHNLMLPESYFWKELLREEGFNIGRLDSRYLGIDKKESGNSPDYSAELTSWLHSFTPAINYYFQEILKLKTDVKYNMFGNVQPWNYENNNTLDNLRQAMAQNPYLHVLYQTGYYDGATTYFNAKYSMWQIDPSGKLKNRMEFKGYRSGHMMYLRKEDLQTSNEDLRNFILRTSNTGKQAEYLRKSN